MKDLDPSIAFRRVELPGTVHVTDVTATALDLMKKANADFIPVTAEDTGKLLGVVLRKAAELGCGGMGHEMSTCAVRHHLKTNVRFVFQSTPIDTTILDAAMNGPVVVVDHKLIPVGIIEPAR